MRVTMLGCGSSGGVPIADGTRGGNWGMTDPTCPRNRRLRCALLVENQGAGLLVDAPPDLRTQLLSYPVPRLSALLFTHAHADHVQGIDDLRHITLKRRAPLDAWMDDATMRLLTQRFAYAFRGNDLYPPLLSARTICDPMALIGLSITAITQEHGKTCSLGFRFGKRFAYSTDVSHLDDRALEALAGIEVWIVGCLREEPHPSHAHLARVLSWVERIKPRRTILTHMNHHADYARLCGLCPPGVEPGYDGLVLEL